MNKKIIIAFFVGITIASVPWYFHSKKIEHQLDLMYLGLINPDGTIKSTKDSISFESILADEAIKNNKIIKSESKGLIDNMLETTDNFIRHKNFDKLIGEKVPEFEYADRNGKLINITDFIGQWVLIDVWASWCKPCMGDIDLMKSLEDRLKKENIVFLGVSIDSEKLKDKWINVLDKRKPSGIQLLAGLKNKDFKEKFLIETVPRYILINPNGKIVEMDLPRPYDPKMEEIIKKHLQNDK